MNRGHLYINAARGTSYAFTPENGFVIGKNTAQMYEGKQGEKVTSTNMARGQNIVKG